MRCPLADAHDYVEAESAELGPHLVCVDCDAVLLPFGALEAPDDEPVYGLIGVEDW